jgi:hypothetical protein
MHPASRFPATKEDLLSESIGIETPIDGLDAVYLPVESSEGILTTNRAAPAASPTYTSRNTPPLASATRKSQHHHYSTTTHHHFVTINNGLTPARLEMLPAGNQLESQRNSAWRRLCLPPCEWSIALVAGLAEATALTIVSINAAEQ